MTPNARLVVKYLAGKAEHGRTTGAVRKALWCCKPKVVSRTLAQLRKDGRVVQRGADWFTT